MNQQTLDGGWNEIKGKLRQKWGQLTDADLPQARGGAEQIIGVIQRKTGEGREAIESYVKELYGKAGSGAGTAVSAMRDYATHASDAVQHTAKQAADQVSAGYNESARFVRDRPGESMMMCFAVGFIAGAVLTWSLHTR